MNEAHVYNGHAPGLTVLNEKLEEVCPCQHIQVYCNFIQQKHLQSTVFLQAASIVVPETKQSPILGTDMAYVAGPFVQQAAKLQGAFKGHLWWLQQAHADLHSAPLAIRDPVHAPFRVDVQHLHHPGSPCWVYARQAVDHLPRRHVTLQANTICGSM